MGSPLTENLRPSPDSDLHDLRKLAFVEPMNRPVNQNNFGLQPKLRLSVVGSDVTMCRLIALIAVEKEPVSPFVKACGHGEVRTGYRPNSIYGSV